MTLVSLIIPTKNEADTIEEVIRRARIVFKENRIDGEIIVVDSSTDETSSIARLNGAIIVIPEKMGYGNAYLAGFQHAQGSHIVLIDGDLTYDPLEINKILAPLLNEDYDMIIGSRLKGKIFPGSMPAAHQYIGNPLLTWLLNKLYGTNISDAHCGLRAINKGALEKLDLRTGGMEFASEMVIEASRKGLKIGEVPINYYPRKGRSKLNSFSDGWRHLRFLMLYRPVPFLLMPGLVALMMGLSLTAGVYMQGLSRMHSLILGSLLLLAGYQLLLGGLYFNAFGEAYGVSSGSAMKKLINYHSLEKELIVGIIFLCSGVALGAQVLLGWRAVGFGSLYEIQTAMMAMIFFILGLQTIFSSMFISLLLLNSEEKD